MLTLSVLATLLAHAGPTGPTTPLQRRLFADLSPRAAAASSAARGGLLEMLGDPKLRLELAACCPAVANLAPAALLARIRDEIAVSEVVSPP